MAGIFGIIIVSYSEIRLEELRWQNTSDSIEEYIKELLGQSGIAEIQRSNLADTFQVVPSQD